MNTHLSFDECLSAVDDALASVRMTHLDECDVCRREVDEARSLVSRIAGAPVPEPSPLFWDHFSARVRVATSREAATRETGPSASWRAWWGLAAMTAGMLLAVWLVRQPWAVVTPVVSEGPTVAEVAGEDERGGEWDSVMALTADWSIDDLDGLTAALGESPLLVDELTPTERAVLARLLEQEMGVVQ